MQSLKKEVDRMLHEVPETFDNQFRLLTPQNDDFVLSFFNGELLYRADGDRFSYPTVGEVGLNAVSQYLFTLGDRRYFLGQIPAFQPYAYHSLAELRGTSRRAFAFAGITGGHLAQWYADNRYCGRCGRKMTHSKTERAMECGCGNVVYPKICPAVIIAVLNQGRICLTKYNRPNAHWALVAGYTEIGETLEQTVVREVREETGLQVRNLRYFTSQPWGLTGSLLAGFVCEAVGDDTIRVDQTELKEGKWFYPDEIDFENDGVSLTRELIHRFKCGLPPF